MPVHPLVTQSRFARAEVARCLEGVSAEEAVRRLMPMNCLSWIVGHLASQERAFWVLYARGHVVIPGLHELVGFGRPASSPQMLGHADLPQFAGDMSRAAYRPED